jgi:hypothetical protein
MPVTRYLAIAEEKEPGKVGDAVEYIDPESAELDPSGEQLITYEGMSGLDRIAAPGPYSTEGSISTPVDTNAFGWFLKWLLGGYEVKSASGSQYKHRFYPAMNALLDTFTARVGKDYFEHVFSAVAIDKMEISLEDSFLTASIDTKGGKDSKSSLKESVTFTDGNVFAPHQVTMEMGNKDVSAEVTKFTLSIENSADNDNSRSIGSRFPKYVLRGGCAVSLDLTFIFKGSEHLEAFWDTADGPTSAGRVSSHDAVIHVGDDMDIILPRVLYNSVGQPASGRDPIEQTATLKALMTEDGASGPIEFELTNDKSSYNPDDDGSDDTGGDDTGKEGGTNNG